LAPVFKSRFLTVSFLTLSFLTRDGVILHLLVVLVFLVVISISLLPSERPLLRNSYESRRTKADAPTSALLAIAAGFPHLNYHFGDVSALAAALAA
jgi:hypothetical protein